MLIAELNEEVVALFSNYSTWEGRPGIYLEDLYVDEKARGPGAWQRPHGSAGETNPRTGL